MNSLTKRGLLCTGSLAALAGSSAAIQAQPDVYREQRLFPSLPPPTTQFPSDLALQGDVIVAGHGLDDQLFDDAGAVVVFERVAGVWVQKQVLHAADADDDDEFGVSVAIDGDTLAIGARNNSEATTDSGSVYAFRRTGTDWTEEALILPGDPGIRDYLGISVDISGGTIVAGAFSDDLPSGADAGSAYVFVRNGTTWSEQAKLDGHSLAGDSFGFAVAIDGDTVVVGAPGADVTLPADPSNNSGSAWVFVRSGTTWSLQTQLLPPDGMFGDNFGNSVAVSGDVAVVGVRRDDDLNPPDAATDSGSAHVFRRSGTTWSHEAKLVASSPQVRGWFGDRVAVDGDLVVVVAPTSDDGPSLTYVFQDQGAGWVEIAEISEPCCQSFWRTAIAVDGNRFLTSGAGPPNFVDVYRALDPPATYCTGKTNSLGCVPFVSFAGTPGLSATGAFTVQANDLVPGQAAFFLYGYAKANLAFHGGVRCIKAPFVRWLPAKLPSPGGAPPCTGIAKRDFNNRIQSGIDPMLTAGGQVTAQWLQRDPLDPFGFGDGLTDAVRFFILP